MQWSKGSIQSCQLILQFYMLTLMGGDVLYLPFWVVFDNTFQIVISKLLSLRFLTGSGGLFDLRVGRSIDFLIFNVSWCCSNVFLLLPKCFFVDVFFKSIWSESSFYYNTIFTWIVILSVFICIFFTLSVEIGSFNCLISSGFPTNF